MKRKFKYMHTIKGHPANFVHDRGVEQVCYAGQYVELVDSLKEIRQQQARSIKWRAMKDYPDSSSNYDYRKVYIE